MPGLEVLGAVSAVAGLAGACLTLLDKIEAALAYGKTITDYLGVVYTDTVNVQSIVRFIAKEEVLQVPEIAPPLQAIQAAATMLDAYVAELVKLTEAGGGFRKFTRSLLNGQAEQSRLHELKETLLQAKVSLILGIQVSTIGVMKEHNSIVVNLLVVNTIDRWLTELPDNDKGGLNLNTYLKKKGINEGDGYIKLSNKDLEELIGPPQEPGVKEALAAIPSVEIVNNKSWAFSTMINGRIGDGTDDPYAVAPRVGLRRIEGCETYEVSMMVNEDLSRHDANQLRLAQSEKYDKALAGGLINKIGAEKERGKAAKPA